jgi:hypothetical protein
MAASRLLCICRTAILVDEFRNYEKFRRSSGDKDFQGEHLSALQETVCPAGVGK